MIALAVILVGMPLGGVLWRGSSITALSDAVQRAGGSAIRSVLVRGIRPVSFCTLGSVSRLLDIPAGASELVVAGRTHPFLVHTSRNGHRHWTYRPVESSIHELDLRDSGDFSLPVLSRSTAALSVRIVVAGFSPNVSFSGGSRGSRRVWFRRVFGILAPIARPVLVAGWAVTFVCGVASHTLRTLFMHMGVRW